MAQRKRREAVPEDGEVMIRLEHHRLEIFFGGRWRLTYGVVISPRVPSTILKDGMTVALGVVRHTAGHCYRVDPS